MPTNNAPKPDHALVASLLPSISTPAAVLDPDGHMLKKTAQSVIAKLLNLLSIANILNAVYSFGKLTTGIGSIASAGFSSSKIQQWSCPDNYFSENAAPSAASRRARMRI